MDFTKWSDKTTWCMEKAENKDSHNTSYCEMISLLFCILFSFFFIHFRLNMHTVLQFVWTPFTLYISLFVKNSWEFLMLIFVCFVVCLEKVLSHKMSLMKSIVWIFSECHQLKIKRNIILLNKLNTQYCYVKMQPFINLL